MISACAQWIFLGLVAIAAGGCGLAEDAADLPEMGDTYPEGLPNIVFILTDDQRVDTLFTMPTVEALARQGTTFSNAIVTTPVCAPARVSILSGGFYAHNTEVVDNATVQYFDDADTIATALQKNGYRTGFVGKYVHDYKPGYVPPGWTRFVANSGGGMIDDWFNLTDITVGSSGEQSTRGEIIEKKRQYVTYFQRDQALEFLDSYGDAPFFLFLSTYAPHAPMMAAPEDQDKYSDYVYRAPLDTHISDKPEWVRKAAAYKKFPWTPVDSSYMDYEMQDYLKSHVPVDRSVKAIVKKLDELHVLDKTIIIFASDNGMLWGEHGLADKGMPYEPAIRVPLIIAMPGGKPSVRDDLVAMNLDVSATIFDIAKIRKDTDGLSLLPIVQGKSIPWRDEVFIESDGYLRWWKTFGFSAKGLGFWTGLRTKQWKYIEHPTGETELYKLDTDPDEMINESGNPAYRDIEARLVRRHHEIRDAGR